MTVKYFTVIVMRSAFTLKSTKIPKPTIARLCKVLGILDGTDPLNSTSGTISSKEIGQKIGVKPFSIRKDFTFLSNINTSNSGYNINKLKNEISSFLGFTQEKKACVIGLGQLGEALLNYSNIFTANFKIIAGFDSSINRIETMKTEIPLYPTCDLIEIITKNQIDLAVLTISNQISGTIIDRLIKSKIKGIVNFSPNILSLPDDIYISNIDIEGEFRFLSALFNLKYNKNL